MLKKRSSLFLLVFFLQGLLQFVDWTGVRRVCDEGTQGLELLLHANIFKLFLLGDGRHLFNLFLCCSQRLTMRQIEQIREVG